jgi:nucleotide-binding universal stress UspA family protein
MPIVAAVDQSERSKSVIKQARELADVYGVELHIVHVGNVSVGNIPSEKSMDSTASPNITQAKEDASEVVTEVANRIEGLEEFEAVGLLGDPAEELIKYSTEHDAECIVVSGRKQSALGRALFGSVTQSLLLSADRPVVVSPPEVQPERT